MPETRNDHRGREGARIVTDCAGHQQGRDANADNCDKFGNKNRVLLPSQKS